MEALGRLAGGVAHDFNNLLTAITGRSELIAMRAGEDARLRGDIDEILDAATRGAGLTQQLLAFSRKQVIEPKVLDLNTIVSGTERLLARLIGEDLELKTVLDPAPWPVKADAGQLEQILVNLAVNARDAMVDGGRLTIATAKEELREGDAPGLPAGDYAVLPVVDSGTGMDEATAARVFEPFFTTKDVGKGTGLGLAMVHGIVEQSGGAIRLDTAPSRGTAFTIYLPRAEGVVEVDARDTTPEISRGKETVLIVEDEKVVRGIMTQVVEGPGYRVLEAEDGAAALRVAAEQDTPFDLLITDVVMPGLGGPEVAAALVARRPGLKVLYVSGYAEDVMREDVLGSGTAFLSKPFPIAELAEKVRALLDEPVTSEARA